MQGDIFSRQARNQSDGKLSGGVSNVSLSLRSPDYYLHESWVLSPCRCLEEEMILSHCVRETRELFTEWIMNQLHSEWCCTWRDENSVFSLAPLLCDSTLEILLPASHRRSPPQSGRFVLLAFNFRCSCCIFGWFCLKNIIWCYSPWAAGKIMCFSPRKDRCQGDGLWLQLHIWSRSGRGRIDTSIKMQLSSVFCFFTRRIWCCLW